MSIAVFANGRVEIKTLFSDLVSAQPQFSVVRPEYGPIRSLPWNVDRV
jgi:hypothetical protein